MRVSDARHLAWRCKRDYAERYEGESLSLDWKIAHFDSENESLKG